MHSYLYRWSMLALLKWVANIGALYAGHTVACKSIPPLQTRHITYKMLLKISLHIAYNYAWSPVKFQSNRSSTANVSNIQYFTSKTYENIWNVVGFISNMNFKNLYLCTFLIDFRVLFFISFIWRISTICQNLQLNSAMIVTVYGDNQVTQHFWLI